MQETFPTLSTAKIAIEKVPLKKIFGYFTLST